MLVYFRIIVLVLFSVSVTAQSQTDYIKKNYPGLYKKDGSPKIRTWKYKKSSTEYLNLIRTNSGLKPVRLSRWVSFQCNLYSLWHGIFYRELRHANIWAGTWENLNTDLETYIDTWMDSPGHRSNMMDRTTYKIGIGYIGNVAVQRGRFRM
jgi:hypothetical protein